MENTRLHLLAPPIVSRQTRPAAWRYRPTAEHALELHVVLRGTSHLHDGDAPAKKLEAGDVLMLRGTCDLVGETSAQGGAETLTAHYPEAAFVAPQRLSALPRAIHLPAHRESADSCVGQLVRLLRHPPTERTPIPALFVQHVLDALLVAVLALRGPPARPTASPLDPRIGKALALLEHRLAEPWTTSRLAKAVGMSRAAFALRFAATVGAPPRAYLARLRMARACALLAHSDASAQTVALAVGYQSLFAFSRAFKRAAGVPPTVYRRRQRANAAPIVACTLRSAA